jgi:hypothetical protein
VPHICQRLADVGSSDFHLLPAFTLMLIPMIFWPCASSFNPILRSNTIAGHQFVNADCSRFTPTKAVNMNQ